MKIITKLLFVLSVLSFYSVQETFAQEFLVFNGDTVNQRDSNGEKHGRWARYLNDYGGATKKLEDAKFYYIEPYYHGKLMQLKTWLPPSWDDTWKKLVEENIDKDFPILLDGEYYWYSKYGQLKSLIRFENGLIVYLKAYSNERNKRVVDHENLRQLAEIDITSGVTTIHLIKYNRKGEIRENDYYIFNKDDTYVYETEDLIDLE